MNLKTAKTAESSQRTQRKTLRLLRIFCGFCDKGITLLELLIAISLLLLVLAAATSVDIAGQWFFKSTSVQAEIQDELQPAMEHIVKNIQLANFLEPASFTPTQVRVRIDYRRIDDPDIPGAVRVVYNNTPADNFDDTWVTYRKSGEDILYEYDDPDRSDEPPPEPIAKGITNNDIFSPFPFTGIFLNIKMIGERVIQESTESVTLISGATLRCRRAG